MLYRTRMKRIYSEIIQEHLHSNRQMIFIAGPRQVGKTTVARLAQGERGCYVNWDNFADRNIASESKLPSKCSITDMLVIISKDSEGSSDLIKS